MRELAGPCFAVVHGFSGTLAPGAMHERSHVPALGPREQGWADAIDAAEEQSD